MSIAPAQDPNYTYGIKLPIPRIEKVEVYSTYFNIEIALYFNPKKFDYIGSESFNEYFTFLNENLKIYSMFVRDFKLPDVASMYSPRYYAAGEYTDRIPRILNKDKTIWNYLGGDEYTTWNGCYDYAASNEGALVPSWSLVPIAPFVGINVEGTWDESLDSNIIKLNVEDFSFVEEQEQGDNIIVKYKKRIENIISTTSYNPLTYILKSDTYGTDIDVSLFCWASLADVTLEQYVSDGLASVFASDDGRAKMYELQDSPVSYQHIIQSGKVKNSPEEIWIVPGGVAFHGEPLQDINLEYYTDHAITRPAIVNTFNELLSQVPDGAIPSIKRQVSYILAMYGETSELIPQLDAYRKSMTEKSNTTEAGKFYTVFKNRILETNRTLTSGIPLLTQLINNPVVVDYTASYDSDVETGVGDLGEYDGDPVDFIFYDTVFMNRVAIVDEESWEDGEWASTDYPIDSTGYFFFDYERALRTSLIARIANINIMESLLGKEFVNYYYLFNTVSVQHNRFNDYETWYERWASTDAYLDIDDGEDGINILEMTTYFEQCPTEMWTYDSPDWWTDAGTNIYPSTYYPEINYTETVIYDEDDIKATNAEELFLRLRSFNVLNQSINTENYRLACFEFYEYLRGYSSVKTSNDPNFDYYRFAVRMRDNTHMIFFHLRKFYKDTMQELEFYLDAAGEACGTDNEGNFNSFFHDAVYTEFMSDLTEAPWIKAPIVYWLHKDLWNKGAYFGGSLELLSEQCETDSALISPATGTIAELQSFYQLMSDYWDEVYLYGSSDIFDLMITLPTEESMNPLFGVQEEFGTSGTVFMPVPWVPESYGGEGTTAIDDPPTSGPTWTPEGLPDPFWKPWENEDETELPGGGGKGTTTTMHGPGDTEPTPGDFDK